MEANEPATDAFGHRYPHSAGCFPQRGSRRNNSTCSLRLAAGTAPTDPADPLPEVAAALDKQWIREEVACALRVSTATAAARAAARDGTDRPVLRHAQAVRRAVLHVGAHEQEKQRAAAVDGRRVVVRPAEHGMAELWATASADQLSAAWAAIDHAARCGEPEAGDERTVDQRRADALIALLTGTETCRGPGCPASRR